MSHNDCSQTAPSPFPKGESFDASFPSRNDQLRVLSSLSKPLPLLSNDPQYDPFVDSKTKKEKLSLSNSSAHDLANEPDCSKIANPLAEKSISGTIVFSCVIVGFLGWIAYLHSAYLQWCQDPGASVLPDTSIVTTGIPIFLICILVEWIASVVTQYETFRLNDTTASFSKGLMQTMLDSFMSALGDQLGVALITAIPYRFIFDNYRLTSIDGTLGFILMFFARDFCYYWFHVFSHQVAFLWAVHGVHHEPNEFNLSVNLSQGAIQRITSVIFYLPLAFFFSPELYALVYPVEKIYGFLTHTKMINKCYLISNFFVTPSSHRVHHGGRPAQVIDRNFGEMLTIWDRIFGTFQEEQAPIVFGHVMPMTSFDPLEAQIATFRELWEKSKQTPSLWRKILCFIGPPGYNPVGPEYDLIDSHPYNTLKYDSRLPGTAWTLYATLHQVLIVAMGIIVLRKHKTMNLACLAVVMLYLTFASSNIGKMWDRNVRALSFETLRLILLPYMVHITVNETFSGAYLKGNMFGFYALSVSVALAVSSMFALKMLPPLVDRSETEAQREERIWVPEHGRKFKERLEMEKKFQ